MMQAVVVVVVMMMIPQSIHVTGLWASVNDFFLMKHKIETLINYSD